MITQEHADYIIEKIHKALPMHVYGEPMNTIEKTIQGCVANAIGPFDCEGNEVDMQCKISKEQFMKMEPW